MWHLIQVNLAEFVLFIYLFFIPLFLMCSPSWTLFPPEFVLNTDSWAIFLHIRAIYWHSWAYLGNNFGPISYSLEKTLMLGVIWGQEEKGTTEDEMAGWHHWLDGRESEWTLGVDDGQGGLACCDSWGRKESDTTEWLIWSDRSEAMNWRNLMKKSFVPCSL